MRRKSKLQLTVDDIEEILCDMGIYNGYRINSDMSVDVQGNVLLTEDVLLDGRSPIQFGVVLGSYLLYAPDDLTSLEGSPKRVGGDFICAENKKLTSLEGSPIEVCGSFDCSSCGLTSLKGAPKTIKGDFNCSNCKSLNSSEGAPDKIGGRIIWDGCGKDLLLDAVYVDTHVSSKNRPTASRDDDDNVDPLSDQDKQAILQAFKGKFGEKLKSASENPDTYEFEVTTAHDFVINDSGVRTYLLDPEGHNRLLTVVGNLCKRLNILCESEETFDGYLYTFCYR